MTWKEQVVVKILLLVARIFADDPTLGQDIKTLSTHISAKELKEPKS